MAKDAKGHGSEKRGVSRVQARNDRMFAMFDRAKAQGHTTFNAAADAAKSGTIFGKADASEFARRVGTGELHTQELAAQHNLPTSVWNRPAGSSMNMVSNAAQAAKAAPDLKSLNRTYNRNENNNFHSENIALLAKNFGTPQEHAQAKEIIAARNKQGSLPGSTASVPNVRDWQYGIHQKYIRKLTGE